MPNLPHISPDLLKSYQDVIAKSSSPATSKRKAVSLNRFFDWAEDQGHISESPFQKSQISNYKPQSEIKIKGNIATRTWATIGLTGALIAVLFLLAWKLKFPIPFIMTPAQENVTTTISQNTNTIPASGSVNLAWNLFAKLRVTDANDQPITSAQTLSFKLFDTKTGGTPLYTSSPQTIKTDANGSVLISIDGVPSDLFFQNKELYLEPQIASSSMAMRIPISTANTAANLGGYFPANPDTGAAANEIPVIDSDGALALAGESPAIKAKDGNLLVEGQAVTIKAVDGSGGNIEINPDANGYTHFLFEGNKGNFLNAQAPNLTGGSLYYGMVPNNSTGYYLLKLQSGAPKMTTKYSIDALGNTNQTGSLATNGIIRLTSGGTLTNITGYWQNSGNFVVNQNPGDFASITKNGTALTDVLNLTLNENNMTSSHYSSLVLNRLGGDNNARALLIQTGNAEFNGQLQLGRYTSNPGAIGQASVIYNTTDNLIHYYDGSAWQSLGTAVSTPFSLISSGTNTTAAMVVGTGASLGTSGTGTITATSVNCINCITNSNLTNSAITINSSGILSGGGLVSLGGSLSLTATEADTLASVTGRGPTTTNAVSVGDLTSTGTTTFSGITYTWPGSITANDYVLQTQTDGTLNWVDPTLAIAPNIYWAGANGAIFPKNNTLDVLIGADSTTSAKFAFTGVLTGTPTASIAGTTTGVATYITGDGTLATTNRQNLTIGGDTTGNITLAPSNNISGGSVTPGVDNMTDLGTAALRWRNIYATTITGTTIYQGANQVCDAGGSIPGCGGVSYWEQSSLGVLYPVNNTVDVLFGSSATASAKFAFTGINTGGTPTASIAGSIANVATFIDGNGNISTTNGQDLVLGNSSNYSFTGNILLNPLGLGNVGIGTTSPLAKLSVIGTSANATGMATLIVDQYENQDILTASASGIPRMALKNDGTLELFNATSSITNTAGDITIDAFSNFISFAGDSIGNIANMSATNATLSGSLAFTGVSPATIDILNGDRLDFRTSVGGDTGLAAVMTILNNGNVGIGLINPAFKLDVSGDVNVTGGYYVNGFPLTASNWQRTLGSLAPLNITDSINLGATATASALIHLAGTAGENSWINTGNVGIGTTAPNYRLTVQPASGYSAINGIVNFQNPDFAFGTIGSALSFRFGTNSGNTYSEILALQAGASTWNNLVLQSGGGNVGIGTTTPASKLDILGTVGLSPFNVASSSGASLLNVAANGNVGIGLIAPQQLLDVNGYIRGQRFVDTSSDLYYIDPASSGTSVSIDGNIVSNGAFSITSGATNGNITINAGAGTVVIGDGTGKLDAGLLDPAYTINGDKFATYGPSMVGVKEETTGTVGTSEIVPGQGYRTSIDFAGAPNGSDLWLFANVTNLSQNFDKLVVLLSPSTNTKAWYTLDPTGKIYVYTGTPTTVSYRLTAPRFDAENWGNTRNSNTTGFSISGANIWPSQSTTQSGFASISFDNLVVTVSTESGTTYSLVDSLTNQVVEEVLGLGKLIAANIKAGIVVTEELATNSLTAFQGTVDNMLIKSGLVAGRIQTKLISPLPDETNVAIQIGSESTASGQFIVQNASGSAVASIDNEGNATFAGTVNSQQLTVNSASVSGTLYADEIKSKSLDEIQALLAQVQTDQALLAEASTWDIMATNSASLDDIVTANLYVTNQAAINSLSVTNALTIGTDMVIQSSIGADQLAMNTIDTLTSPLKIQSLGLAPIEIMAGLIKIDTLGNVQIAGNLAVGGRVQSSGLTLQDKVLNATDSATLLTLQNSTGTDVASINSSGSASFANISTQGLTIAGATDATNSAVIDGVITTNATAGSGVIPTGVSEITIKNPKVTDYTLVYVTPTSSTENYVLYVKSKTQGEFTVGFTNPIDIDVNFNWWIVQVSQ